MKHIPKNQIAGYTEAWLKERDRLTKFYQDTPYFGTRLAQKLYETMQQAIPAIIQASHCGKIISLVTHKQDKDKARMLLAKMFNVEIKEKECQYTGYITTFIINK